MNNTLYRTPTYPHPSSADGGRANSIIGDSKGIETGAGNQQVDQFTSLVWSAQATPAQASKKSKKDKDAGAGAAARGHFMVVAGTASGSVRAFDTASLSPLWTRPGCHEGSVSCVAVSANQGVLSCGADTFLCVLDPSDGHLKAKHQAGKSALTAVAAVGADAAVVGSTVVAVYDVKVCSSCYACIDPARGLSKPLRC